jgi:soluble lytic murein transglycosylase-like protein
MTRFAAFAAFLALTAAPVRARTPSACPLDGAAEAATRRYDAIILRASQRRRLNPRLVKAIIAAESQFSAEAVSPRGARGLMQLMPATAWEMGVAPRSLTDPEQNISAGTRYLALLYDALRRRAPDRPGGRARVIRRVIAAYHAGPRALRGGAWPASTRRYVRAVLSCYGSDESALSPDEEASL